MPKISGVNHLRAVKALGKVGFRILRQRKKHIVISDGTRFLTIPRNNPIIAYTMSDIVRNAGDPDVIFRGFVERCLREKGYEVIGWRWETSIA